MKVIGKMVRKMALEYYKRKILSTKDSLKIIK